MTYAQDITYWMALAHLPRWERKKINRLIVQIIKEQKNSLVDFFEQEATWTSVYGLTEKEIGHLVQARLDIPNLAFVAESLLNQGFEIITLNSPDYSDTLKNNLQYSVPPILYVKGNKNILKEKSIAIVGSRDASDISLAFTDRVAKKASEAYQVVVSGFAKGVDQHALECALKYTGQSIIVLPQGILTFNSGIKKYYSPIVEGNLLVLSEFPPQAGWSSGLAMARNKTIYGLAKDIYVAQSGDSGGTWSGVKASMKSRVIYVRQPGSDEQNANQKLIDTGLKTIIKNGIEINMGIQPVNDEGIPIEQEKKEIIRESEQLTFLP